jgi:hypothetical protein
MANEDSSGDPVETAVKAAAKRSWGCERAPASLCQCVQQLMRSSPTSMNGGTSLRLPHRRASIAWFVWPIAAIAATFAVAVGIKSLLNHPATPPPTAVTLNNPPAQQATPAAVLPAEFESALVKSHDHCCHATNHHHLPAPIDNDAAIAVAMRAALKQPAVLMARPTDAGWDFRGAAICPVGTVRAGHLVFVKDDEAISVFTLPATAAASVATDGAHFEATADGHSIATFARDGGLFCLVASGPADSLSLDQLSKMRDAMMGQVSTADVTTEPKRTEVAQLMYSIAGR